MLTFLHIFCSKNRMKPWACCAAEKKQGRYKTCRSHDDQSWHSNCNLCSVKSGSGKGFFCNWLGKNWSTSTSSPYWNTTQYWISPPSGVEGWTSNQIFKKGRLDWTSAFRGGLLGMREVTFLGCVGEEGWSCNFHIKNKLKSEIFNDKKS